MYIRHLFLLTVIILFANFRTLFGQGYVSPFKYENGNFRLKTSTERMYDESKVNMKDKPSTASSNSSTTNQAETRIISEADLAEIKRYAEKQRIDDSIKKANRYTYLSYSYMSKKDPNYNYTSTEHYKLFQKITDLMYAMEYDRVDSITQVYWDPLSSEKTGSSEWAHYRARLVNRMLSQLFSGRVDSAWQTLKRLELAAKTGLEKHIYSEHSNRKDMPLMRSYILYEGGAYDEALAVCEDFIGSLPSQDSFSSSYPYIFAIKSRCQLAVGNVKEAKRILDEYMHKTTLRPGSNINYSGMPIPYLSETYGLIYQKLGQLDSALRYFRSAVKLEDKATGLEGYARDYNIYSHSYLGWFEPPVTIAFLETALTGGYKLGDLEDEGFKFLMIANNLGIEKAIDIIDKKTPWNPPVKTNSSSPVKQNKATMPVKTKN